MRNRPLIVLVGIIIGCSVLIFILITAAKKQLNHNNSFNRKRIANPTFVASKDFIDPVYNIVSIDSSKIYLMGKSHGLIYVWEQLSDRVDTLKIPLPNDRRFLNGYDLTINYPKANAVAKNYGGILAYENSDTGFILKQIINLETTLITRSVLAPDNFIFLRAFDTSRKYQEFQKINLETGRIEDRAIPFETKFDAGFSSDGILLYDSSSSTIIYIQYYQNTFYCMDTSLNVRYSAKTIDTVSTGDIQTKRTERDDSSGSLMPSTPLIPINKTAGVCNGKLYVLSLLQADNESDVEFQNNSEIDIYNVKDGKYNGSLYLPNVDNKKALDIKIKNDLIYAIYKNKVAIFKLQGDFD